MKYVQINAYSGGWADSIIFKKHRELVASGDESWVFWARGEREQDEHLQRIASYPEVCLDVLQTRLDGKPGFHSKAITRRLLKKLDEIDPDVVHLHLLLGYYINIEMLFEWLAAHRCKVVWTLHDCWAFTGHCIYFTHVKCVQWKAGCAAYSSCPQKRTYPETFAGDGAVCWSFEQKKRLFTMLSPERVQLITPSQWLADLVKQSFLGNYSVKVVHDTVNTDIFKPTPSDFRERFGLEGRFVVLGVAASWSERKRLSVFIRLARELDPERFSVVVVGLAEKQINHAKAEAPSIVALPRTSSMEELAEIYTACDVLLNPSAEETFGMNVAEAAACGTGAIVVKGSACAEVADPEKTVTVQLGLEGLREAVEDWNRNRRDGRTV
ncbi:glycosyltransferase [Collinsella aerofaciens]|uniref:Alpha-galactosylglucosyldiacylglycerol synthase n=1 Tax=Collinsella aerofaciens TaxID=74426 RepID=A0A5K1J976_9ACTN|nr:glycosyltransferase [Collinsella aerofaciens]VWM00361.1 Alpha-galactosylglucosyldiacylglycerol synthase [Collinsella aerofaciens]